MGKDIVSKYMKIIENLDYELMTWRNAEGEIVYIRDIDTSYLVNIKNFIIKCNAEDGDIFKRVVEELNRRCERGEY